MGNTGFVGVGVGVIVVGFDVVAAAAAAAVVVAVVVVVMMEEEVMARGKHTNMFMTGTAGFWLGDLL